MYNNTWFLKRMRESHPKDYNEYVLCSDYINSHTKVTLYHKKCKSYIEITPNSFISGRGCKECHNHDRDCSNMLSLEEANSRLPKGVSIVPPYKGLIPLNTIHCSICGETYKASPHDIIRRGVCSRCTGRYHRSSLDFAKEVSYLSNNEYSLVGPYLGANVKTKVKHLKCGTVYEVTPHNFKHGKRCPNCISSSGEHEIMKILEDRKLSYEHPKIFTELTDIKPLHFDFYVPEYNLLIEYQGVQHYMPVDHFGGVQEYSKQRLHDVMKREYAIEHGYNFIAIPYKNKSYTEISEYIDSKLINIGKPRV